ncbi:MAG: carbohydrate kinase family protein [Candidatus Nanopelagicales bacterium]
MNIVVTGSIATDHLMTFPGRFVDSLVADKLDRISLSFLVDQLEVRRGGVAANIAFGIAALGLRPYLVGAVGPDFADYRSWLDRNGVDTESVRVSQVHQTARFVCTTDQEANQLASFYAGAMSEARDIELAPVVERIGGVDLVVIGANDPEGMLRHTQECRARGYAFAADPSQQLARMDGDEIRQLIDGAAYLFTNEYEAALTEQKTGWSNADIAQRVECRVTTLGAAGARVERAGSEPVSVHCPKEDAVVDPTGVGDAFRAGFMAGLALELSDERSAQLGSLLATSVIETVGTQEYRIDSASIERRLDETYGGQAAGEICSRISLPV